MDKDRASSATKGLTLNLLMVAILAISCGGDGDDSVANETTVPSYIAELLGQTTSDFQRGLLADGVITPAEYEQATFAYIACLDDAGIPHSVPELTTARGATPKWRFQIGPWPSAAELTDVDNRCREENSSEIEEAWSLQEAPSQEEIDAVRDTAVACANAAGFSFADYDTMAASLDSLSQEDQTTVALCIREAFAR
jgi:hypothetical protein